MSLDRHPKTLSVHQLVTAIAEREDATASCRARLDRLAHRLDGDPLAVKRVAGYPPGVRTTMITVGRQRRDLLDWSAAYAADLVQLRAELGTRPQGPALLATAAFGTLRP